MNNLSNQTKIILLVLFFIVIIFAIASTQHVDFRRRLGIPVAFPHFFPWGRGWRRRRFARRIGFDV